MHDFDVAIVGGGSAGLLVAEMVREVGLAPVIVADHSYGALAPASIHGRPFTMLPIHVASETSLADRLNQAGSLPNDMLKVSYQPSAEVSVKVDAPQCLSFFRSRLFGELGQSFEGVRKKESKHYGVARPKSPRFGYVEGLSPYYKYLQQLPAVPTLSLTGARFDFKGKSLAVGEEKVRYRALVWAHPLEFLRGATDTPALPAFECVAADASFCVLTAQRSPPANLLVYECSGSSPVYRVFTPDTGIAVAQLCHDAEHSAPDEVAGAVGCLFSEFSEGSDWRVEYRITTRSVYPISLGPAGVRASLYEWCESCDVLLFGRFGRWEYKDLHDLDWGAIDGLIHQLL